MRRIRLTLREWEAINEALGAKLAGVFEEEDDVDAIESAKDKVVDVVERERSRRRRNE